MNVHCECGQVFEIDEEFKGIQRCPHCDGLNYQEIPPKLSEVLLHLFIILIMFATVPLINGLRGCFGLYSLVVLVIGCLYIVWYPIKTIHTSYAYGVFIRKHNLKKAISTETETSGAVSDEMAKNENSDWQGIDYCHKNVPRIKYGSGNVFMYIFFGFLLIIGMITLTIMQDQDPKVQQVLFYVQMASVGYLFITLIFVWNKYHLLEMSFRKDGIHCKKLRNGFLSWGNLDLIYYKFIPAMVYTEGTFIKSKSFETPASLILKIYTQSRKYKLTLQFETDAEVEECLEVLKQYAEQTQKFTIKPQL